MGRGLHHAEGIVGVAPSHPKESRGGRVFGPPRPQGGNEFSPDPQERDKVGSEEHLPLEGPRLRGWPGDWDSCQRGGAGGGRGPLPSLPAKALPVRPRPG